VSGIGAVFIMAGLASALNTLAVVEALVMYEGVDKESDLAQRLEGFHEDWKKRNFRYLIRPWE
jgi:hypothetical protein